MLLKDFNKTLKTLFISVIMTDVNSILTTVFENINDVSGSHIMHMMMMIVTRINDTPHSSVML